MGANSHSEELPEPKTPLWMPFVGAALFLLAALGWLVTQPPNTDVAPDAKPAAAEAKPAAAEAKPAARPKAAPSRPAH